MTKENSKRLYDHYVKTGNVKAASNMLDKYPEFGQIVAEEPEDIEVKITKKSKK